MQRYVATFIILAVLSLMVWAGENMDYREKVQWGPTVLGIRLSITADRPSYHIDQPIRLHLWLENLGDSAVHILKANIFEVYRFHVLRPDGAPAHLTPEGERKKEAFATYLLELQAGESDRMVVVLDDIFDMTMLGEYTVRVYRKVLPSATNTTWTEVQSNEIKIKIHDRAGVDAVPTIDALFRDVSDQKSHESDTDPIKLDERGRIIEM